MRLVQLPLPTLDNLAYPRAADGLVHQCAWCWRVLDRAGRFRIWARVLRGDVSHGVCSKCAPQLRLRRRSEGAADPSDDDGQSPSADDGQSSLGDDGPSA